MKTECDECDKDFMSSIILQRHIMSFHDGDYERKSIPIKTENQKIVMKKGRKAKKSHKCETCGKKFSSNSNLWSHNAYVHGNKKDHKCEICGKGFSTKSDLLKHGKYVHEGLRNYKCETCGKGFHRPCRLKEHIENVHENVFNCAIKLISYRLGFVFGRQSLHSINGLV